MTTVLASFYYPTSVTVRSSDSILECSIRVRIIRVLFLGWRFLFFFVAHFALYTRTMNRQSLRRKVTILIFPRSTTLSTVEIFRPVRFVTRQRVSTPVRACVRPFICLMFHPSTRERINDGCVLLVSLRGNNSRASRSRERRPPNSSMIPTYTVKPRIMLRSRTRVRRNVTRKMNFPFRIKVVNLRLIIETFRLSRPRIRPRVLMKVRIMSSRSNYRQLLINGSVTIRITLMNGRSRTNAGLRAVLMVILYPRRLRQRRRRSQRRRTFARISPRICAFHSVGVVPSSNLVQE